jgi:FMN phosphatase YigB (HAD superfamily)
VAVSFDLFGTLVTVDRSTEPATAVGSALADRGVTVPDGFERAYRTPHHDDAPTAERPLAEHVRAALASCGVDAPAGTVADAVLAAFTDATAVRTRDGAQEALAVAAARGPVGVCSNCRVRGLVAWALRESALAPSVFETVVASVDCGWRKPDRRVFAAVADGLGVGVADLVHVGDDPATDGGVTDAGGVFVHVCPDWSGTLPERLEGHAWD